MPDREENVMAKPVDRNSLHAHVRDVQSDMERANSR